MKETKEQQEQLDIIESSLLNGNPDSALEALKVLSRGETIVNEDYGNVASKDITVRAHIGESETDVIKRVKEQLVLENYFSDDVRVRAISDYNIIITGRLGYDNDCTGYRLMAIPKQSKMFTEEEVEDVLTGSRMATKEELNEIAEFLSEPKEETKLGLRYNEGKVMMELVPYDAIVAMAEVLTMGAKKYEKRNWEKGMAYSTAFACLQRHLIAFWNGEDKDKESGLDHMAHVLCNAAFLYRFTKMEGLDDRPSIPRERK